MVFCDSFANSVNGAFYVQRFQGMAVKTAVLQIETRKRHAYKHATHVPQFAEKARHDVMMWTPFATAVLIGAAAIWCYSGT